MTSRDDEASALLPVLRLWAERGWLRRLDAAFARMLAELAPSTPAPVLLAAALVAHVEGHGDSCLVLDAVLDDPALALAWSADAVDALRTVLPVDYTAWIAALRASEVVAWGDADPGRPLVLHGDRLYLKRYWKYERRVGSEVIARGEVHADVDEAVAGRWLDRLFPDDPATDDPIDWQKVACALALRGRLSIVTGGPGTGKTYTAARFLALRFATAAEPQRLRIALAAPTGKAAARLRQSIDGALDELQQRLGADLPIKALASRLGAARTLHGLLGARPDTRRFRHDASHPLDVDVVIVDEASMIHLEMMAALLAALPPDAQVVLLGDKDQLASVEAGAVLGDLCRDAQHGRYAASTVAYVEAVTGQRIPDAFVDLVGSALAQQTVMLRRSQRFGGAIGGLAQAVNAGDAKLASKRLGAASGRTLAHVIVPSADGVVELACRGREGALGGYTAYLDAMRERPMAGSSEDFERWVVSVLRAFDRFRVLCALREGEWGVAGLNTAIEARLAALGLVHARGEWYEGRPVIATQNDYGTGVFNGDVGIVLKGMEPDAGLRAWFAEGDAVRSVSVSRLAAVQTAFAMTVHKAQGSEFDHTVLVLPPEANRVTTRELVYTGITRARTAFTLMSANVDVLTQAIGQTTRRSSGLSEWLR